MSKTDNLTDFLTDVADAIRTKKGSEELINPQDFSYEILNLPSGSGDGTLPITVDKVSNVLYDNGVLSWTPGDYSSLEEYDPVISYVITINDNKILESQNNYINISEELITGTNTVEVQAKSYINVSESQYNVAFSEGLIIEIENEPQDFVKELSIKLPTAYRNMSSITIGDYIYIVGGQVGTTQSNKIYKFDPNRKTLEEFTTLSFNCAEVALGHYDNCLYILGGSINRSRASKKVYKIDMTTKEETSCSDLSVERSGFGWCQANNCVYMFAGANSAGAVQNTVIKYNLQSQAVSLAATLPSYLNYNFPVYFQNNIYVTGGENPMGSTPNFLLKYNPSNDTYNSVSITYAYKRYAHIAGIINNKIYVATGRKFNTSTSSEFTGEILESNLTLNNFSVYEDSFPTNLWFASASTYNNSIYVFGGSFEDSTYSDKIYKIN